MGEVFAFTAALGFTLQLIFIRLGCEIDNNIDNVTAQKYVLTAALFGLVSWYTVDILLLGTNTFSHYFLKVNSVAMTYIFLEGLFGSFGGLFLLTRATNMIGPTKTSILRATNPLFTTIFAAIILKESPGIKGILAIFLLIFGIWTVTINKKIPKAEVLNEKHFINKFNKEVETLSNSLKERIKDKKIIIGSFYALLAGISFSFSQVARGVALEKGATAEAVVFWGLVFSYIILMIIMNIFGMYRTEKFTISATAMNYFILAGIGLIVGSFMLVRAFQYIDVWKAVAIRNSQPILSIGLSYILLKQKEIITFKLILGAIIVVFAIWLTLV